MLKNYSSWNSNTQSYVVTVGMIAVVVSMTYCTAREKARISKAFTATNTTEGCCVEWS